MISLYCDKKTLLQRLKMLSAHCATTAENDVHSKFEALFEVNNVTGDIVITTNNFSKPARMSLVVDATLRATPTSVPPLVFDISELISILKALGTKCRDIELQVNLDEQAVKIHKVRKIPADLLNHQEQFHRTEQQFTSSLYIEQANSVHNFTAPETAADCASWQVTETDIKLLNNAAAFADECHPQSLFISLTCDNDGCTLSTQSELGHCCSANIFKRDSHSPSLFTKVFLKKEQLKAISSLCQTFFKIDNKLRIEINEAVILLYGDSFIAQIELEDTFDLIKEADDEYNYASFIINKKFTDVLSAHSQSAQSRPQDSVTISSNEPNNTLQLSFEIGKSQSRGTILVSEFTRDTEKTVEVKVNRAILVAALKLVQTNNLKAHVSFSEISIKMSSRDNSIQSSVYLLG